jgi:large subunit ribosomal protein L6
MSRIGKKNIEIPSGVEVKITGQNVMVKGPKGELSLKLHPRVEVKNEGSIIKVNVKNPDEKLERSLWGTFAKLIINMIHGVTHGYEKKLEMIGVGYRATVVGSKITFNLGFSHPVEFNLPEKMEAKVEKNILTISGSDKQLVGEMAAQIRKIRPPEPYKGTGIRYVGEVVRKKAGKKAVSSSS